jgi:alcohol dehydrogenase class IV
MIQDVKIGSNSVSYFKSFLSDNLPKSIFLVTGKDSFFGSGAHDKLEPILRPYKYCRFHDFEDNPKVEDVERGIDLFKTNKCDLIVAVGGGSVIDMAKLVNIFHSEKGDISPYILNAETKSKGCQHTTDSPKGFTRYPHAMCDSFVLITTILPKG